MHAVTIPNPEIRERRVEAFRQKIISMGLDPYDYGYSEWLRNKNYLNAPFGSDEYGNCDIELSDGWHFDGEGFWRPVHVEATTVTYYTSTGREIGPFRRN